MEERYAKLFGQLNKETQSHSKRVAKICRYLAPVMGIDEELAYRIGYVHDVGKLYIPSRIIKKSESLTELEREIVDLHSYYGYKMLKDMGDGPEVYIPVLFHHGFLKPRIGNEKAVLTEDMMKSIYVIHSADVYDAMMNKRVYHEPFSLEQTLDNLKDNALSNDNIINALAQYRCTESKREKTISYIYI